MFAHDNEVAQRSALSYLIGGYSASVEVVEGDSMSEDGRAPLVVVVPSLRRLDFVVDEHMDLERIRLYLSHQSQAGWEVWALVPLDRLAEAHDACRGVARYLQGWWKSQNGEVAFTSPEIP